MIWFPEISKKRFYFIIFGISFVFFAIVFRLCYFQTFNHRQKIDKIIEKNRRYVQKLPAKRGNIVDCNGKILATSHFVIELGIDPSVFNEKDTPKLSELAKIIRKPLDFVNRKARGIKTTDSSKILKPGVRWKKLSSNLSESQFEQVKKLNIKGICWNFKQVRIYPSEYLAAHVVGYISPDEINSLGIERFCNFYLKGQDGLFLSEKDARQRELRQFRKQEILPVNGLNVELTIDSHIQKIVEDTILEIKEKHSPKSISIIISDAKTGKILSLANYPSFDPNNYSKFPLEHQKNRTTVDIIEPGSTFKLITVSSALNEKVVSPFDTFNCQLLVANYRGRDVRLPNDWKSFGLMPVKDILKLSSNRGIGQIAMKLGEEKLVKYAKLFGFGERTGYSIDAESPGILHETKDWDGLTISRFPIGHAIGGTMFQTHFATGVIANRGILMKPQIINRIFDEDNETFLRFHPKERRRVISESTAKLVTKIITQMPSENAYLRECPTAGKSGTAQKIVNGRYSHSEYISSFSGFFPTENPKFVISIFLDSAKYKGTPYGSQVAAPFFKELAKKLLLYFKV